MSRLRVAGLTAAAAAALPAWAQYGSAGYTYVKMSLAVPWALYFVFLACVLIPFALMVVLAWRSAPRDDDEVPRDEGADAARRADEAMSR